MLQNVSHKFRSGCMMLARRHDESVACLGTAFLVHQQGYLLTAAHATSDESGLVVVPGSVGDDFVPLSFERVAAMAVQVVSRDRERDVALLRIEQDIDIAVPYDFLGRTTAVRPGASVMSLGYSFGPHRIHALLGYNAVVSAKIRSANDTALVLYDTAFHEGDRGGPLIHVADGHVIGLVSGRFEPGEIVPAAGAEAGPLEARQTNVSFAVAIEYGLELMRAEGLID